MTTLCNHLNELLKVQESVIRHNLNTHKWLQHIADPEQAMIDFIEHYGWIMREVYCGHACVYRNDCSIAQQYLPPIEPLDNKKEM